MALQFILGPSGSGRSCRLFQWVIEESIKHPDRRFLVIVPEQFTMSTQRALVTRHPRHGILNIDVLSFKRLAQRVFEETGTNPGEVLTETGKNLLIRRASSLCRNELEVMGSRMDQPGYVSEIKSILSEFAQYEIAGEDLDAMIALSRDIPLLYSKLKDIRTLHRTVEDLKRSRFITGEQMMEVLARSAPQSVLLDGAVLAFDGFTGFTPVEYTALQAMMKKAADIKITLTMDSSVNLYSKIREYELFAMTKQTVQKLSRMAQETGTQLLPPVLLKEPSVRFKEGSGLQALERILFRWPAVRVRPASFEDIHICGYTSPAMELNYTAEQIRNLIVRGGYRCRDIAVIAGSLPDYAAGAQYIFGQWGIPLFIDQTVNIVLNPCLEFIRGALEMTEQNFSYESVFRFLRSGCSRIAEERIDELENYCLALGIRGRNRWQEEWTRKPRTMPEEQVLSCEQTRASLMERLGAFPEIFGRGKQEASRLADELKDLCGRFELKEQMEERSEIFRLRGERAKAMEFSQIYDIVMDLLKEIQALLGTEVISGREFSDILEAGFSEAKIGIIPPGIDQVHMGDLERTRLENIKVLFFVGMNDGWVPAAVTKGGIVSEMEREFLENNGFELSPDSRESSYRQRFYLYLALTKPSDALYLSWSSCDNEGRAMRPSMLIRPMEKDLGIVSGFKTQMPDVLSKDSCPTGKVLAGYAARMVGSDVETGKVRRQTLELLRQIQQSETEAATAYALVRAGNTRFNPDRLTESTAKELYGQESESSVTRLETFAGCAYEHFAAYGLRLNQREIFKITPADTGNLYHEVLRKFGNGLKKNGYTWHNVPEEEARKLIDRSVAEETARYANGLFTDSARSRHTAQAVLETLRRSVWAFLRQIRAGLFEPAMFEWVFGGRNQMSETQLILPGNVRMNLRGRVDRIDLYEEKDKVFVKVVDYKSGNRKFDPALFYCGVQLQLSVYLNAVMEREKKLHPDKTILPAGILYEHLSNPLISIAAEETEEELDRKLLLEMRPEGLISSDSQVLYALDRQMSAGSGSSLAVRAAVNKSGSLSAGSHAASFQMFSAMGKYTRKELHELGGQIMTGHIEVMPAVLNSQRTQCDYCPYRNLCGFDLHIPGNVYRDLTQINDEEAWKKIIAETEEAEETEEARGTEEAEETEKAKEAEKAGGTEEADGKEEK